MRIQVCCVNEYFKGDYVYTSRREEEKGTNLQLLFFRPDDWKKKKVSAKYRDFAIHSIGVFNMIQVHLSNQHVV